MRLKLDETFDEQPMPDLDSEALDFRVVRACSPDHPAGSRNAPPGNGSPGTQGTHRGRGPSLRPGARAPLLRRLDPGRTVSWHRPEPYPRPREIHSHPVRAIEEAIAFVQKHGLHGAEMAPCAVASAGPCRPWRSAKPSSTRSRTPTTRSIDSVETLALHQKKSLRVNLVNPTLAQDFSLLGLAG